MLWLKQGTYIDWMCDICMGGILNRTRVIKMWTKFPWVVQLGCRSTQKF